MRVETEKFGPLDIRDESVVEFGQGLYGFEELRNFAVIPVGEASYQLQWLQSIEDPGVALLLIDPTLVAAGYNPPVAREDLDALGLASLSDAIVMSVCVLDADPAKITTNLQAPVIFNPQERKGRQVIVLDPSLPVRQSIFQASGR